MSGIAGVVLAARQRPVDHDLLGGMAGALAHRGPDGQGTWRELGAGLAHRRLALVDLSPAARQPLANEDGSLRLVFDGQLSNWRELRGELGGRGHRFVSSGDAEVIVHLYEELGDRLLERIEGMFAFALWDGRRRRLLLARDRVGEKSLKYARLPDGSLLFASELKALLATGLVPRERDLAAIDDFLGLGFVPAPRTGFAHVRKLPAGHKLVWHDGALATSRYWSLDFRSKPRRAPEEWREAVRGEVRRAVQQRLAADVPVGAWLSGGVDSSIVVACMAQGAPRPVRTFAIGLDDADHDESTWARRVAEHCSTEHHELRVRAADAKLLPELARVFEEPYADPAALPTWLLARETRRQVAVALSGDEAFSGSARYARALRWRGRWLRASGVRALASLVLATRPPGDAGLEHLDALFHLASADLALRDAWLLRLFSEREKQRLWRPGAQPRDACGTPAHAAAWLNEPAAGRAELDRLAFADLRGPLPDQLLVKTDLAAMAHALEVRAPLLDPRLLELAAGAPAGLRAGRQLLRRAFADALPAAVLARPRQGYGGLPLEAWFRGPLRDLARNALLAPDAHVHAYLQPEVLAQTLEDHDHGRAARGHQLWGLVMLELWHQAEP